MIIIVYKMIIFAFQVLRVSESICHESSTGW